MGRRARMGTTQLGIPLRSAGRGGRYSGTSGSAGTAGAGAGGGAAGAPPALRRTLQQVVGHLGQAGRNLGAGPAAAPKGRGPRYERKTGPVVERSRPADSA